MLFGGSLAGGIERGEVTLSFRHRAGPQVKVGGRYRFWGLGHLERSSRNGARP